MRRWVSFVVLLAIVIVFGVLFYQVIASFLVPMFLAMVLVVLFRPVHKWLVRQCGGQIRLASVLTTLTILLIILVPMLLVFARATRDGIDLVLALDEERKDYQDLLAMCNAIESELSQLAAPRDAAAPEPDAPDRAATTSPDPSSPERTIESSLTKLRDAVDELEQELANRRPGGVFAPRRSENKRLADRAMKQRQADLEGLSTDLKPLEKALKELQSLSAEDEAFLSVLKGVGEAYSDVKKRWVDPTQPFWMRLVAAPAEGSGDDSFQQIRQRVLQSLGPLASGAPQFALTTTGFIGSLLLGVAVMTVSMYYFFADGPAMIETVMQLSPLEPHYERELLTEFTRLTRAVVAAMLISATVQGLLAGIGYYFAGFEALVLLTVTTMVLAMVPFVGAASVWGACSLWLFFVEERTVAAVCLAIYGALIVSMIDNIIKPMVLHGQSNLHPLLALLSVLGGVQALGPIGIFVGPMAVAFLYVLLKMLQVELRTLDAEDESPPKTTAVASRVRPVKSGRNN